MALRVTCDTMTEEAKQVKQVKEFRHIVRVANTDIDGNKSIGMALLKIKGISFMYANALCKIAKVDSASKTGELGQEAIDRFSDILKDPHKHHVPLWMLNRQKDYETGEDGHLLTGDLDYAKSNDIKRLKMIRSYRGTRHTAGLPSRGQRTRSNFRKNKGKVTGVQRKKSAPAKGAGKK
jgi:small subunit ribosomal protein S13